MQLEDAIKHAIDGNALLFLGSGFSVGATSISEKPFPTAKALAKQLATAANEDPDIDDLMIASNAYMKKIGAGPLVELLEKTFTLKEPLENHIKIATIPWKAIFTTNYDDIVETAYKRNAQSIKPVTIDMDTHEYTSRKLSCIHINGYIGTLTQSALNSSFKLTNYSYLTEEFSKSKWSFIFRREIESAKAIIFIGYSMYDIDISRILYKDESIKSKTIFVERKGLTKDNFAYTTQDELGHVQPIGLDGFWEKYNDVNKEYEKPDHSNTLISLTKFDPKLTEKKSTDDEFWGLLLKGDYSHDSLFTSIVNKSDLFIYRKECKIIADLITSGSKAIFALGDLGNGKTLAIFGAACQLIREGYSIYYLDDNTEFHPDDISNICSTTTNTVIIIENYIRHLDALKLIALRANSHLKIICSARSVLHEVNSYKLDDIFSDFGFDEVYIDKLNPQDIDAISQSLTDYKVWGSRDSWAPERKIKHIRDHCKSEFSSLLLDIASSPDIQERYSYIFSAFREKTDLGRVFITAAVLSILGYEKPKSSVIAELTNSNFVYSHKFKQNEAVLQMVSLGSGTIIPRSSVIAKYGLSHFSDASFVVENLIEITKNAHELGRESEEIGGLYFRIYRDLVTFSVLQPMMPERKRRESLIRFYEALKNLSAAKQHPHFWLQYAIARLSMDTVDDAKMAKSYLDAAYAHAAKRKNYHTRHLDNVLARYHFIMARYSDTRLELMENILAARGLLLTEAKTEKTDAAYKVARLCGKVFIEKIQLLTKDDVSFIKKFMESIIESSQHLPETVKDRLSVKECVRSLSEAISIIPISAS